MISRNKIIQKAVIVTFLLLNVLEVESTSTTTERRQEESARTFTRARDLLSVDPNSNQYKCYDGIFSIYGQSKALYKYAWTILPFDTQGLSTLFGMQRTQPFCQDDTATGGLLYCDAKRIPQAQLDFAALQLACEEAGGEYQEVDVQQLTHSQEVIKNVPVCFPTICQDSQVKEGAMYMLAFNYYTGNYGDYFYDVALSDDFCDDRPNDQFFVKTEGDSPVISTCAELSKVLAGGQLNKNPCDKRWSPDGQPAFANVVCPATCRSSACGQSDNTQFFKNYSQALAISSSQNSGHKEMVLRTCKWLENKSQWKKKKVCKKVFNRVSGLDSVPSAFAACPHICQAVV